MTGQKQFSLAGKKVFVAGHRGMVGSALTRRLATENCTILTVSRDEVDLRDQSAVRKWFKENRPDAVFLSAGKVGGILANNNFPAEFIYDNIMIEANIIEASHYHSVQKLLFLGSSCIYPKLALQPISESSLLTGPLEPTNEWYAVAKIAGIKLAQAFRRQYNCDFVSVMPTNLYGLMDNFDLSSSHVLPALIRKTHDAKIAAASSLEIWGTGSARREFLYVDDLADACVFLMENWSDDEHINIGSGKDISILELTRLVCEIIGFNGRITHDREKPDGTPRKLMLSEKLLALGWFPKVNLRQGIDITYRWFLSCENRKESTL